MNDIAKETQIGLKTKAFEIAQQFYLRFEDSDPQKVVDLAKEIYTFLASESEQETKKDPTLTTKPCIRCGHLRVVRNYPDGKSQSDDCLACGYPKNRKRGTMRCRICDSRYFFEYKKMEPLPVYCPWCKSDNILLNSTGVTI